MMTKFSTVDIKPAFFTIPNHLATTIKLFEFFINRTENRIFQIVDFVDGSMFETDNKIDYVWLLEIGDRSQINKRKFLKIPLAAFVGLIDSKSFEFYSLYNEKR